MSLKQPNINYTETAKHSLNNSIAKAIWSFPTAKRFQRLNHE